MRLEPDFKNSLFAKISYFLILVITYMPWLVEYYETGHFFRTEKELLANIVSSLLNFSITLFLIYFFVQKNQLYQMQNLELQRLSVTDYLTQIYNSRFFHIQLEKEIDRAARQKEVFSLLFIDLDGFKRYNDSHGHAAGDEVLKEAGHIIKKMIREVDTGARYGGDEFSVILINTDLQAAYEIGERIRTAFHEARNGDISLSMGISLFRKGDSSRLLFKRADKAMYRAKTKGGNRIELESWRPSSFSHYDQTA